MVRHSPGKSAYALVIGIGLALLALAIALPTWPLEASSSSETLTVTRAELDRGRLRVEGENADANATITVTSSSSEATGESDAEGRFRVEADGFDSVTCQVTVSDGTTEQVVSLDRCDPTTAPPPPPPGPGSSISVTRAQLDADQLRIEGEGALANATIFIDDEPMGNADAQGRFRVERSGFNPSSCTVNVSDGFSSAQVTFEPCSVPPRFTALEVELLEEPLGVPATLHADPKIDSTQLPAGLPPGSIASFEIEGVATKAVDQQGVEWQIGSLPLFVYTSADTRIDDAPQSGDLVRVGAVRTLEAGPLVAERIRQRQPGPLPVGPVQVEIAFLFSDVFQSEANDVLTVGGVRFAITALTEIDPLVVEGDAVLVVFLLAVTVP